MRTGAVILAVGNDIDYVAMAAWSSNRIERHLGLPTTLITDREVETSCFDQVIRVSPSHQDQMRWFEDIEKSINWQNHDRCDVFDLSPYDRTLLLDADYVVCCNNLLTAVSHDQFWFYDKSLSLPIGNLETFGRHQHPMSWATVIAFSRDKATEYVFKVMRMIRDNWQHYRDLYQIDASLYRNDYALSIALLVVNGHVKLSARPAGTMFNVLPNQRLRQIDNDVFEVLWKNSTNRWSRQTLSQIDIHAMCKRDLGAIVAAH
jgi:hypothetical protein